MARWFGYSRVSTSDQDWSLQLEALTKAGVDDRDIVREKAGVDDRDIVREKASGAKRDRTELGLWVATERRTWLWTSYRLSSA